MNIRTCIHLLGIVFLQSLATMSAQTLGTWDRILIRSTFPLYDVVFTDSLNGYAVGDFGVILRTTDSGITWSQKLSPDQFALRNVWFFTDSIGLAAGFRGSVVRTTDAGDSWTSVDLPYDINFPGMATAGSTVWLSGEEGLILKSTDTGVTWTELSSGTKLLLDDISFSDERHGWASSLQRTLLRTTDGGASWKEHKLDTYLPVSVIRAVSADECWLLAYQGQVLHSIDAGASWSQYSTYRTDYFDLKFDTEGRAWAVGRRGAIVRAQSGNRDWRLHDMVDSRRLNAITFLPNGVVIAVGDAGGIYRLARLDAGLETLDHDAENEEAMEEQ